MKMNKIWEIWKYSLEVSVTTRQSYDITLLSRTSIFVSYMVTNAFIISGVIRHWNNVNSNVVTAPTPGFPRIGTALAEKVGRMSRPLDLVKELWDIDPNSREAKDARQKWCNCVTEFGEMVTNEVRKNPRYEHLINTNKDRVFPDGCSNS